jgi:hypothetical protein
MSSLKVSVGGLFGGWGSYASQQLEHADQVARDYLMADAHPDAQVPVGLK